MGVAPVAIASDAIGRRGARMPLRLIEVAEDAGGRGGVAINALFNDFSVHDPKARLWPQTERLKGALLAASVTGRHQVLDNRCGSSRPVLSSIWITAVAGLWLDMRLPNGVLVDSPAPASSFYHLVGGIAALAAFLGQPP